MSETFQDWVRRAIDAAGGQSELARRIKRRFPQVSVSPQAIQHLAVPKAGKKPAQSSRLTPFIAAVMDMPVYGLSDVHHTDSEVVQETQTRYRARPISSSALERAQEIDGVEYTKDALLVAKAFMDLPRNKREEFKRKIETAALEWAATTPDSDLHHLAAPGTDAAAKAPAAAPQPARKRRHTSGTQ